jgi:hypothetical protein
MACRYLASSILLSLRLISSSPPPRFMNLDWTPSLRSQAMILFGITPSLVDGRLAHVQRLLRLRETSLSRIQRGSARVDSQLRENSPSPPRVCHHQRKEPVFDRLNPTPRPLQVALPSLPPFSLSLLLSRDLDLFRRNLSRPPHPLTNLTSSLRPRSTSSTRKRILS